MLKVFGQFKCLNVIALDFSQTYIHFYVTVLLNNFESKWCFWWFLIDIWFSLFLSISRISVWAWEKMNIFTKTPQKQTQYALLSFSSLIFNFQNLIKFNLIDCLHISEKLNTKHSLMWQHHAKYCHKRSACVQWTESLLVQGNNAEKAQSINVLKTEIFTRVKCLSRSQTFVS